LKKINYFKNRISNLVPRVFHLPTPKGAREERPVTLISCPAKAKKFNLTLSQDGKPYQTENL